MLKNLLSVLLGIIFSLSFYFLVNYRNCIILNNSF